MIANIRIGLVSLFLILTGCVIGGEKSLIKQPTQIGIDNFAFSPAEVTVPVGTRVIWTNHDDVIHTATSDLKPRLFKSGALDSGYTFSVVFDKPGTYSYFCEVHPHMTGKIIVTAGK